MANFTYNNKDAVYQTFVERVINRDVKWDENGRVDKLQALILDPHGYPNRLEFYEKRITGLTRIMREGAVEGKTQEPPCGTNVVQTTF